MIGIHPLVIAAASDHYTRVLVGGSKLAVDAPIYGLIFGTVSVNKINEQKISLCEGTETPYQYADGKLLLNPTEIDKKVKLWLEVYPNFQLLGWYTVNQELRETDLIYHNFITGFIKSSPLILLVEKNPERYSKRLPVSVFCVEQASTSQIFVQQQFHLESSLMEQLSMDQIIKSVPVQGLSSLEVQNQSLLTSLMTLDEKIGILLTFLEDTRSKKIETNHNLLRSVSKICMNIPAMNENNMIKNSFHNSISDGLLIACLGAMTKTTSALSELSLNYNVAYGETRSYR
eukprot:gene10208-13735_t